MPAQRPRAAFEPVSPDLDLRALVEDTPNFQFVDRISCDMIDEQGMEAFDKLVQLHVVLGGKPLVIDGYQSRLDPWTFSSKWLQDNCGERVEDARDLRKEFLYTPLTIGHYLKNMNKLSEQYHEKKDTYRDLNRQRVYLKDIDCPDVWRDKLRERLPPNLFYLNETVGVLGGPGSADELAQGGGKRKGKGIACAGDLMSSLPSQMRAENMMCYIGHEGTYTPAHREMCASLGHNIMVETSDNLGDDGKPERPGSSIWFMTESKDRHMVSEYWLSILGHDIEVERHFAQLAAWKKAPFTTYIVEQKAGDFILIPPLAPHQVWNRGTRTMKAAWNRTTVETLEMAFNEALPNARMVCRDEQYKNKAIVYFTLQKYSTLLAKAKDQEQTAPSPQEAAALRSSSRIWQLRKDFKKLFNLFKTLLLSEMFSPDSPNERNVQFFPFDSNITCAYCRGNIFNKFLSCGTCEDLLGTTEPEPYDICMDCYAMGRSCGCISKLRWSEQFKWKELTQNYEQWRRQVLEIDGDVSKPDSPLLLQEEWQLLPTKTLAHVCQEQLKRRPWVNVRKETVVDEEKSDNEEIKVNDEGVVIKTKTRRSETWLKKHHSCHVCAKKHEKWKMAECKCGKWWCYGSLFRGHDLMPQQITEDPTWQCPHCKLVCNAGSCRKDSRQKPYEPKGTLLGHDTKKVADARSVESMVDFSISNLNWLKETTKAPTDNLRLKRRQEEAELNKLDDPADEQEDEEMGAGIEHSPSSHDNLENSLIDPSLREANGVSFTAANRPSASSVPAVSALPSEGHGVASLDGYEAARQIGFVAPTAVMQRSSYDYVDAGGDYLRESLPFNAEMEDIITEPSKGKKRKRPLGASGENAEQGNDEKPVNDATKQYRKEKERHALEEARRKGRFILTQAKLRGKSKIIKLNVGTGNLAGLSSEDGQTNAADNKDLLRSDVQPEVPEKQPPRGIAAQGVKPTKAVRIRVEKDDDFGTRKRGQKSSGLTATPAGKKNQAQAFEEVEIESDSDGDVEPVPQLDGAFETTGTGHKRRRTSAWQSKLHEDDVEELPEELPSDWKDGKASKRRNRRSNGALSSPTSASKPISAGTGRIPGSGNFAEGATVDDSEEDRVKKVKFAEERSLEAKLQATEIADEEDDASDSGEDYNDGDLSIPGVKPVASLLNSAFRAVTSGSIFSKQKPGGRKIKIVSRKKKT